MKRIYVVGALALLLGACRPNVSITTPPSAGPTVNFNNYLAIGDNYTGGYTDGSLTVTGQLNSFPERLFEQFSQIPDPHGAKGPFIQPLITSDNGYPGPKKILGLIRSICNPLDSLLAPVNYPNFVANPEDAKRFVSPANNGQINNIGVLGIRAVDYLFQGYAVAVNAQGLPYAYRFYNNPAGSPLDELQHRVNNLYPTFFTMWLGMNDVLSYALYGGQGDGTGFAAPLAPNFYNPRDISPTGAFDTAYDAALNIAISTGASGALINIPDITSLPFFNTIPANGLTLTQGQADTLLQFYASTLWNKVFQAGSNYFIIQDHHGNIRQAVPGELILLSTPRDSIKCAGWGSIKPIPDSFVLTTDEIQYIRTAVASYNSFIKYEATRHKLAYVDMNAYFAKLPAGITYNGITYSAQFVNGGAFSLDGINLTSRGYALLANETIRVINSFYGSTVNPIDVNKFNGVSFP
jgi:hypothetical protein